MKLSRLFHHEPVTSALPVEAVDGLIDAGIALEDAKRQAAERRTWVVRLRAAREENNLSERLRRAFDERD